MKQLEILRKLGIEELTPMQVAMQKAYGEEKDLMLLAPTGTGKTLAYLLPLVQTLRRDERGVQAVVLVPSRELALQTEGVFKAMGTEFKAMSCYGGRPAMDEHRAMKGFQGDKASSPASNAPAVIIGTPGRMNDHLRKGNIDASRVRTLVIDEFDKCLEFGFQEEMSEIVSRLPAVEKRVLLSATAPLNPPKGGTQEVSSQKLEVRSNLLTTDSYLLTSKSLPFGEVGGAIVLDFRPRAEEVVPRLRLHKVISPEKDKLETLYRLLCTLGNQSTLVFCNYRESVERVTGYLQAKEFPCDMFHGGMEQPDRERTLYKLRNGTCPVLVSTDLAARGLDIPSIENIVHYHLPVNGEAFIHRNGRTARWEATGNAYLIIHREEALPAYVTEEMDTVELPDKLPKPQKPQWATIYIGRGKKEKLNKVDIVGFLYKKGGLAREDVGQVDVKEHYAFAAVRRTKMRQLLTLIRGEKIKGMKTVIEEAK